MARRRKNPDDTMKVVLYGGAAALAAWFLFLRKKEKEEEITFTEEEVGPVNFVVKTDPSGARQCFHRGGDKAPLKMCEGLGSLSHGGTGSLGG